MMRYLLIIALTFIAYTAIFAQTNDSTEQIPTPHCFGARVGLDFGRFLITNPEEVDQNTIAQPVPTFIGFYHYQIRPEWQIGVELGFGRYSSNDTEYRIALIREGRADYRLEALELNLVGSYLYELRPALYLRGQIGLSAGAVWDTWGRVAAPNTVVGGLYDIDPVDQFEAYNLGALAGVGLDYDLEGIRSDKIKPWVRKFKLLGLLRFRQGINDINRAPAEQNRYLAYGDKRVLTQNFTLQVGLSYKWSKKVVKASGE